MLIGYTFVDPLVVIFGTIIAAYFLVMRPMGLVPYLPAALSIYFFIATVTLLTLWQTVPLLLAARAIFQGKLEFRASAALLLALFAVAIGVSFVYGGVAGSDLFRALVRLAYYVGIVGVVLFCYEMGRSREGYRLFLKGLVITGLVFAAYGAYQLVAELTGLPYRAILRGTNFAQSAYESGLVRVNSLASEPKRLGYVLMVCGLACFFYPARTARTRRQLPYAGAFIIATSVLTFAWSYFIAAAIFAILALSFYRYRLGSILPVAAVAALAVVFMPAEWGLQTAIVDGYERRAAEVEVGVDGENVYRQDFYGWDYIAREPATMVAGVGLGQYFGVLNDEYGRGVGLSLGGELLPFNSNFLEIIFDFGGIIAAIFYGALGWLVWQLRRAKETYLSLALLFLLIQSFSIVTLLFVVMFAGFGLGRLDLAESVPAKRPQPIRFGPERGRAGSRRPGPAAGRGAAATSD